MNNVNARIQNNMQQPYHRGGQPAELGGHVPFPCADHQNATSAAPPSREIPSRVEQLYGATDELSRLIARLEQRLVPVVEQIPVGDAEKACVPYATELGLQLSGILGRVELMTNAVLSIESRLQI